MSDLQAQRPRELRSVADLKTMFQASSSLNEPMCQPANVDVALAVLVMEAGLRQRHQDTAVSRAAGRRRPGDTELM